jgi:hypothetical protein
MTDTNVIVSGSGTPEDPRIFNYHTTAQGVSLPTWETYLIRLCILALLLFVVWMIYRFLKRTKNKPG